MSGNSFQWGGAWRELRRRKVGRAVAAYALIAWVVLQLAEVVYQPLGLPDWALTWTVLAAVLGFPVVLVLAWFFDVSASGVRRERGPAGAAGPLFAVVVVLVTVLGLGWWLSTVYEPRDAPAPKIAPAGDASPAAPASVVLPPNSVAVLPFQDMTPARDHAHLGDGIAEQLLDALAKQPELQVASRTAAFAQREPADIRAVGERLQARWVVEGSVRKQDRRLRVTAQLIDSRDGYHVWSETYDRDGADLLALQDDVAARIAAAVRERLDTLRREQGDRAGTEDAAALADYRDAREAWNLRTPAALAQAEAGFRRAVERDPQFARGWAGLADTLLFQGSYGGRPTDAAIAEAEPAAVRAVTLDPDSGECWASIGLLRLTAGQLDAARRSLTQAIKRDPGYDVARLWLAEVHRRAGEIPLQLDVLRAAVNARPLDAAFNVALALARAQVGEADAARESLLDLLAIAPADGELLRGLARLEAGQGRLAEALAAAGSAAAGDPEAPVNQWLTARLLLLAEDFARAERIARALPEGHPQRLLLEQEIALRQGDVVLNAGFDAWVEALPARADDDAARAARRIGGLVLLRAGDADRALPWLQQAAGDGETLAPEPERVDAAMLAWLALERGAPRTAAARRIDAALEALREQAGASAEVRFLEASWAALQGRSEAALERLEAAVEAGFRERWRLRFDPRLAALAGAARWRALEERLDGELEPLRRSR